MAAKHVNRMARTALGAALALCVALSVPLPASADDAPAREQVVRTHAYMLSEGDADAPVKEYKEGGVVYKLVDVVDVADPDWEPDTVSFTRSQTVQCAPDALEYTRSSMAASWPIDEQGVQGEIPQVSIDATPVYADRDYQAEQVVTYSFATNDVSQIPSSREFELDTGNVVALERAGVTWSVEGTDAAGLPTGYVATVVYRGLDTRRELDHYDVVASYAGDIAATGDERRLVTATYEAQPMPPAPAPESEPMPEPEPEFPWAAVVGGAAAVAIAAGGGAVVFVRWRNVRLVRMDGDKPRIVCGLHATRAKEGGLVVEIPAKHDLTTFSHKLVLRPDIAKAPNIKITHMGLAVYVSNPGSTVDLDERGFSADI